MDRLILNSLLHIIVSIATQIEIGLCEVTRCPNVLAKTSCFQEEKYLYSAVAKGGRYCLMSFTKITPISIFLIPLF
jgi:hypothetical protein